MPPCATALIRRLRNLTMEGMHMESAATPAQQRTRGRSLLRKAYGALAAAAMLLATGTSQAQTTGQSGALIPIQVGIFPIVTYLPDQVAYSKGFFRKNGLDVTLVGPA